MKFFKPNWNEEMGISILDSKDNKIRLCYKRLPINNSFMTIYEPVISYGSVDMCANCKASVKQKIYQHEVLMKLPNDSEYKTYKIESKFSDRNEAIESILKRV